MDNSWSIEVNQYAIHSPHWVSRCSQEDAAANGTALTAVYSWRVRLWLCFLGQGTCCIAFWTHHQTYRWAGVTSEGALVADQMNLHCKHPCVSTIFTQMRALAINWASHCGPEVKILRRKVNSHMKLFMRWTFSEGQQQGDALVCTRPLLVFN